MLRTPKGCATRGGSLASRIERCRTEALDLFSRNGYRPFCASSLQRLEDLQGRLSPTRMRQVLALTSPHGEPCALRADLTLAAVAYLAAHHLPQERPLRLCYADRVFLTPSPPEETFESYQVGLELLGWEGEGADAEVAHLLLRLLDRLDLPESVLVLGDASLVARTFRGLPPPRARGLVEALQEGSLTRYDRLLEGLEEDRAEALRRLPRLKGGPEVLDRAAGLMDDPEGLEPLRRLGSTLTELGYGHRLRYDLGFIRDLGYYSGPLFQAYGTPGGTPLGGGGRYDRLLADLGLVGQAVGFALELEALGRAVPRGPAPCDALVWCGTAAPASGLAFARELEARGIRAELSWHPRRSASLELARLRGVPWWVDPSEGSALRLGDETSQSLETFYGEVGSC